MRIGFSFAASIRRPLPSLETRPGTDCCKAAISDWLESADSVSHHSPSVPGSGTTETSFAADPAFYATQVRLTMEHPQVRTKRLEILLAFDDAVAEGLMRERPGIDPALARLAAYLPTHTVPATMLAPVGVEASEG